MTMLMPTLTLTWPLLLKILGWLAAAVLAAAVVLVLVIAHRMLKGDWNQ